MKPFLTFAAALLMAGPCWAIDMPAGQTPVGPHDVLRGRFTEDKQMNSGDPMQAMGHFTVAPGYGLIWAMEKPFPTASIVTQNGMAQDLGGIAIKLPAKNLRHIYELVGAALAGNWNELEKDFTVVPSGTASKWQMTLTPKEESGMNYAAINVTGSKFLENIVMIKGDGGRDSFHFSDAALTQGVPNTQEAALFAEVKP